MYKQYNTNQLSLQLNIAWDLPATHEARLISQFVDTIPQSVLLEETSHTGRSSISSSYVAQNDPVCLCSSGILWSENRSNE